MRRHIWLCAVGLALILAGLLRPQAATAAVSLAGIKICIDPGHGGIDPGAVNEALDLNESDINLDTSYALKALLEAEGATVVMTRTDAETGLSNDERNDFANAEGATIVISMHTNSFGEPEPNGSTVLFWDKNDKVLAKAIYDALYPILDEVVPADQWFYPYGPDRFRGSILRHTTMPGVIVEPSFLSNPFEAKRLAQPIYADETHTTLSPGCAKFSCRRGQVALAVYEGIVNYFAAQWATRTPVPTVTPTPLPTATPTPAPAPTRAPIVRPAHSGPFPLA